jgi:hypothetical protein
MSFESKSTKKKNGPGVLKLKIIKQNMPTNLPAESRVELSVQYGSCHGVKFFTPKFNPMR